MQWGVESVRWFIYSPDSRTVTSGVRSLVLAWFTASAPSSMMFRIGSPQFIIPFATYFSNSSTLTPKACNVQRQTCDIRFLAKFTHSGFDYGMRFAFYDEHLSKCRPWDRYSFCSVFMCSVQNNHKPIIFVDDKLYIKGLSIRTVSVSASVTVTIQVYHCAIGNGLFDGQIGFGTHYVSQCTFDSDFDEDGVGDGTCKWTLKLCSDRATAKIFFDVCRLFFDLSFSLFFNR